MVRSLSATHTLASELIETIRNDASLDPASRERAIALAEGIHDRPSELNDRSWAIVRAPGRTRDEYRLALLYATRAIEIAPDYYGLRNTFGVAQYRNDQIEAAIGSLELSLKQARRESVRPRVLVHVPPETGEHRAS